MRDIEMMKVGKAAIIIDLIEAKWNPELTEVKTKLIDHYKEKQNDPTTEKRGAHE